MAVVKAAQDTLAIVAAESVARYRVVLHSYMQGRIFVDAPKTHVEIRMATYALNRYIAFGGDPKLFVDVISNGQGVKIVRKAAKHNKKAHAENLERLGSLPEPSFDAEATLAGLIAYYELIEEFCAELFTGIVSESLSNLQDDAQNAVEKAQESMVAAFKQDATPCLESYEVCEQDAQVAITALKQVAGRLKDGEVPTREYPLSEERWAQAEEMASQMQDMYGQYHKQLRGGDASEYSKPRLEALRSFCFMLVALFNVRKVHPGASTKS
ncbi:MAG: hypothetical protein VX730_07520 [Pseudomonadota bacterium]|nr:hypothetical protein [Pseudomonadota bacterium]